MSKVQRYGAPWTEVRAGAVSHAGTTRHISGQMLRELVRAHNLTARGELCFKPSLIGARPAYAPALLAWIESNHGTNPGIFEDARQMVRNAQRAAG